MRKCSSIMLVGALVLATAATGVPEVAYSQGASKASICDGYARNFARQNSRGPILGGAAFGAIGGAIIGGILGGPVGVAAAVGAGGGAVVGGGIRARNYNALYNQAFSSCMAR